MKLLLYQNFSPRLIQQLSELYPGSLHVRDVGLQEADDDDVWDYAKEHALVIVSKDSDFHQRSFFLGILLKLFGSAWETVQRMQFSRFF